MWRLTRTQWFVLGCGVAAFLLVGFAHSAPAAHDPSCPVGRAGNLSEVEAATCSVPSGPSIDPCSVLTLGQTHCPINTPDLNPVDWAGFIGCELTAGLSTVGSAIWNAVAGIFGYLVSTVANAIANTVNEVVGVFEGAITSVISGIGDLLVSVENAVDSVALGTGPLAPVVITALWMAIGVVAAVALYLTFLGFVALAKTVFNLL